MSFGHFGDKTRPFVIALSPLCHYFVTAETHYQQWLQTKSDKVTNHLQPFSEKNISLKPKKTELKINQPEMANYPKMPPPAWLKDCPFEPVEKMLIIKSSRQGFLVSNNIKQRRNRQKDTQND